MERFDLYCLLVLALKLCTLPSRFTGGGIRRRYRWRTLDFMEISPLQIPHSSIEEDEWDTDGFVTPSLGTEDADENKIDSPKANNSELSLVQARKEEDLHLKDHGVPPTQPKEQEQNSTGRKQRFKLKLKEADKRYSGSGREAKVDTLRELVGEKKLPAISSQEVSPGEWLDRHCHESEFEKNRNH